MSESLSVTQITEFRRADRGLLVAPFGLHTNWTAGRFHTPILDRSVEVRQNEWGLNWKQSSLPLCAMPFSVIRCCLLSLHCVTACVFSGAAKPIPAFAAPSRNPAL